MMIFLTKAGTNNLWLNKYLYIDDSWYNTDLNSTHHLFSQHRAPEFPSQIELFQQKQSVWISPINPQIRLFNWYLCLLFSRGIFKHLGPIHSKGQPERLWTRKPKR